eukprot:5530568-Pyramimonas_sp.AAC.1
MDAESVAASQLPAKSLYEYIFDVDDLRWRPWRALVPEFVPPPDNKFAKILVPTVDTVRAESQPVLRSIEHVVTRCTWRCAPVQSSEGRGNVPVVRLIRARGEGMFPLYDSIKRGERE